MDIHRQQMRETESKPRHIYNSRGKPAHSASSLKCLCVIENECKMNDCPVFS